MSNPTLTIVIPTFNRRDLIVQLARLILSTNRNVEVRVHVDGSTDGTADALSNIAQRDQRLHVTQSENRGRATAIYELVQAAKAPYLMIYDDDDTINATTLDLAIERCELGFAPDVCGIVYQMTTSNPEPIVPFPSKRSNYLKMRIDERVKGDKKEIVKTESIKRVSMKPVKGERRIPSSLSWSRLAIEYDTLCDDLVMGCKSYHVGGMTHTISALKIGSPQPMAVLYFTQIRGYFLGRYHSSFHLLKSIARMIFYSCIATIVASKRIIGRLLRPNA